MTLLFLYYQARKGPLALLALQVHLVHKAPLAYQGYRGSQALTQWVPPDHRALLDPQGHLDHKVHLDHRGIRVNTWHTKNNYNSLCSIWNKDAQSCFITLVALIKKMYCKYFWVTCMWQLANDSQCIRNYILIFCFAMDQQVGQIEANTKRHRYQSPSSPHFFVQA